MIGKLVFKLPEEREDFELAQHGWKYQAINNDLDNWLRAMIKYEDKETILIQEVRDKLRELCNQYEIN